jgi:peptide/nickel transport system ATP-binding protein
MPLLELQELSVEIGGRRVVDRVSLCMQSGEILALAGESASGKSMTALAIARLLPEAARVSGAIRFDGVDLAGEPESALQRIRGRRIGFVFQEPMSALNPLLNSGRQIGEAFALHGRSARRERDALSMALLERVGLSPGERYFHRHPHELSGGERQRVAIAMAIALSPPLLIADEPTTALDAANQEQILALLKTLARERQCALLLITHDLGVVADMADRVAILRHGALVESGITATVLRAGVEPYTRALMSADLYAPPRARAPEAQQAAVLEVTGVVRDYPQPRRRLFAPVAPLRALQHISLTLRRGESIGIVGESGSGKSTLLRSILALEALSAGDVRVLGESIITADAARAKLLRREIQAVFQDPAGSFDPRWTVAQSIAEPNHLLALQPTRAKRDARIVQLLERVGLNASHAHRYAHQLSGGQRQRVAIARALMVNPSIIAFDEALSALDVATRNKILDLLAQLAAKHRIAYLFVSHDLATVRAVTDRVLVMQRGRVVEAADTEQLFTDPQHPYTRELVAAATRLRRALHV